MAKLLINQLVDVMAAFAPIVELRPPDLAHLPEDGLFLCALGFEPRCLTLPDLLRDVGYRAGRAVFLNYGTNLDDNAANRGKLEESLRGVSANVEPIEADKPEFSESLRSLLQLVIAAAPGRAPSITMDISVMANRFVLKCLQTLLDYDVSLRIVYSEAAVYYPTQTDYQTQPGRWETDSEVGLERGVGDVLPSIEHAGVALDQFPDAVVLFPSFKADRSKAVISFVDASLLSGQSDKVVWLVGVPHLADDQWRMTAMRRINGIEPTSKQYEVSTFDYRETVRVLEQLYGELSARHRITLSPLGSKMQAVGTALFCYLHPDVRVVLSTPKQYNAAQYSKGCKATWRIDIGPLAELRRALDSVGTIRVYDDIAELPTVRLG